MDIETSNYCSALENSKHPAFINLMIIYTYEN
jgi:hypothetical protein